MHADGSRIRSSGTFPRNTLFSISMKCSAGDTSGLNQNFYVSAMQAEMAMAAFLEAL